MTVAVALITCDRFDYTARTIKTFDLHNDPSRFMLLHGDDASTDSRVRKMPGRYGFDTVYAPRHRRAGGTANRKAVVSVAQRRGADWVLILENDWEWDREFPWPLFDHVAAMPEVYCMRLFGAMKQRDGRPCGTTHAGKNHAPANWRPIDGAPELAEVGSIHWGAPPSVTRIADAAWLHDGARIERDSRMKSGHLDLLTARPVRNVVFHIGAERTQGFVP